MKRFVQIGVPILLLACALTGAGQQRKRHAAPKSPDASGAATPNSRAQAIRENNIGLALMDQGRPSEALGRFQTACIMDTKSDAGCLNMGIAFLAMQRFEDARRVLAKSASKESQNARAWFNLGLLEKAVGQNAAALRDFEKVAAIDPADADTQYFLGALYADDMQYPKAAAAYSNAVKLNPFHASAELGLAELAQHTGDTDGALAHLTRFRDLTSKNLGEPVSVAYGQQGKYSRAQDLPREPETPGMAIPIHFADVTGASGLPVQAGGGVRASRRANRNSKDPAGHEEKTTDDPDAGAPANPLAGFLGSGACIFDYNGDGKPDIFLVNADGAGNGALYRNAGEGRFVNETKAAKLDFHGQGTGCAVGDYDNDGHPDLAVSAEDGVYLYHNEGNGTFKDVTDAAGIHGEGLALGVTFVDYDADGDLDLYVTRFNDFSLENPGQPFSFPRDATAPGNILWRNKGNGTFMNWTKEMALAGDGPSVGAVGSDINNDRAVDLVVSGWRKAPQIFLNRREGPFRPLSPWATEMPGPTAGIAVLDFNKDGWMDLAFTHWANQALSLWRNVSGKSFERIQLPAPGWMRGWGISAVDYDNDGWIDLVAVGENFSGEGRIILLRNEGPNGFRDVTQETGLDKIVLRSPRGVMAFDSVGDGSPDLLITQNKLPPVLLKNTGANKSNWLQLAFLGEDTSRSAMGAKVVVFAGTDQQKWEVPGASGYLGQGPPEILAGLGAQSAIDVLRVLWPTGILQDQFQVPIGKRQVITESDRHDAQH